MTLAHERARQSMALLLKKIKFSPIVSIQGPRQCGKSYLARHLLPVKIKNCQYLSLDRSDTREFARSNPRSFLERGDGRYFIIDEAQKAPVLFDEMKDIVDERRIPGQFIILGSTEFSIETKITESLTGRLSRLRLYPFNVSESLKLEMNPKSEFPFIHKLPRVSRRAFLRYLDKGGLPGIFSVKSASEQKALLSDWIKLTVDRDLHQIKKYKLDSEIAFKVLEQLVKLETPSCIELANAINVSVKSVQKYLSAFCALFVIIKILPTPYSSGKPLYYLTDTGILNFFGSTFKKQLETWFYLELSSQLSYKDFFKQQLYYYKSPRGSKIHAVFEEQGKLIAAKLNATEKIDKRDLAIFESLKKRCPKVKEHQFFYLSGGLTPLHVDDVQIYPWESIC